ncbi:MAG TPA: flagellin hook IN motif-containing protein [Candidatus Baltobacteraceae bacterium]|nr:flagellin hook IN motif-containing protein [Candidatus Baltobacteraceae bacterium]
MMRISTSTMYNEQTLAIDNLESQYQQEGEDLSTGISLNEPSDDPTVIAQDLSVRSDSAVTTQIEQNLTGLNNVLSTTDSTLSSLTSILQNARSLAIEGASDTLTSSQRQAIGDQVNQLLEETIGLANTQYDGKYIFSGTAVVPGGSLVTAVGDPPTAVSAASNLVQESEQLPNGQLVPTNVTLQQAFNLGASNGSPSVFQMLITLRDTLDNSAVVDESSTQINLANEAVTPNTTIAQLEATVPPILQVPLQADSSGNVAFSIASSLSPNGTSFILTPGETVQQVVAAINAASVATGVSAVFNYQTQRLSLTDATDQPFTVSNIVSGPLVATPANFTSAFLLSSTANVVTNLSTQLGDIDNALTVALQAASTIGATVQTVSALSSTEATRASTDTTVQSSLEDTDIAKVTSQFSLTQTALEAAYQVTSRLEQTDLFDYLDSTS